MSGVIGEKAGMGRDGPELDPPESTNLATGMVQNKKPEVPNRSNPPKSGQIYPDPRVHPPEDNSVSNTIFQVFFISKPMPHVIYTDHHSYTCRKYPATL